MFIFINATKVHSFLLQPKKLAFTPIGEYKMQGCSQRRGRRGWREEMADPCHQKVCALIFKKQIFLTSV